MAFPPQIPPLKRPLPPPLFDLLTDTADDVVKSLESGSITSRQVVESYLSQIETHNLRGAKCRAVLCVNERRCLMEEADRLDEQRRRGDLRGPLHGVPILLKDNIATVASGLPTTAGSSSLLFSYETNAPVVKNLIERGLIIIGKANMTEFMGMKGVGGWSALGGMCQPAYNPTGYKIGEKPRGETVSALDKAAFISLTSYLQTPGGSSTGSAVGVACGFAPISVGTETSGSIVTPAAASALYALKVTPGSVSMEGVMQLTDCFDTLGTFGKSALDVALGCDALATSSKSSSLASCVSSMKFENISVGFVDIEKWRLPAGTQDDDPKYFEQTAREYQQAKDMLRQSGVKVVDVYITPPEEYMVGDRNVNELMRKIIRCQGKNGIERYLKGLRFAKIKTLEDVIRKHKEFSGWEFEDGMRYCTDQAGLEALLAESRPDNEVLEWLEQCKRWAATEGIDKVTSEKGVNVVVCCSDSYFAGVSVAARYPMAAVPLGYNESSGRLYGLQAIAQAYQEAKLVKFMTACECVFPRRRVPDLEACKKARVGLNDWKFGSCRSEDDG
ncbi:Amidase domain-containing protein [Fusarium sp. LHS14.1]|nr:Amidase domain-containing protein [Fusarium sp. LHS14.1]